MFLPLPQFKGARRRKREYIKKKEKRTNVISEMMSKEKCKKL